MISARFLKQSARVSFLPRRLEKLKWIWTSALRMMGQENAKVENDGILIDYVTRRLREANENTASEISRRRLLSGNPSIVGSSQVDKCPATTVTYYQTETNRHRRLNQTEPNYYHMATRSSAQGTNVPRPYSINKGKGKHLPEKPGNVTTAVFTAICSAASNPNRRIVSSIESPLDLAHLTRPQPHDAKRISSTEEWSSC